MNRIVCVAAVFLITQGASLSKNIEFTALGGYQFGGMVDETTQEEGIFEPGDALGLSGSGYYGLAAAFHLGKNMILELSWDRQPTDLDYHEHDTDTVETQVRKIADIDMEHYHVGIVYDWSKTSFKPFIGWTIGMSRFRPSGDYDAENRFSFSPLVGMRSFFTPVVGLRAQGRMFVSHMPSGNIFSEAYYHSKETFMTQFQFGVGVVFVL